MFVALSLTVLLGVAKCVLRGPLAAQSQTQPLCADAPGLPQHGGCGCTGESSINLPVVLPPLTTKPACIAEAVIAPVPLPLTRNPPRSLLPPLRLLKGGGNNPLLPTPLRPAPRPGTQGLNLTLPPSPSVLNPQQVNSLSCHSSPLCSCRSPVSFTVTSAW